MPARDIYHNAVKAALIADGWTITDDPYWVKFGGKDVYIDLGAERDVLGPVLAAERGMARIAVEIKTFTGPSIIVDLEQALGQYMLYQSWLRRTEPERLLYLAVDTETASVVFDVVFGQSVAEDVGLRLIVVDMPTERIVAWRQFPATERL